MNIQVSQPLPNGKGYLVTKEQGITRVLIWNQNFVELKDHTDWTGTIELPSDASSLQAINISIGVGNGSPWENWQNMGRPDNPTPVQVEYLKSMSEPKYTFLSQDGKNGLVSFNFLLKPGEVQYFEIAAPSQAVNTKYINPEEFMIWNKGMGEKSR